jgi:hypothetical protein
MANPLESVTIPERGTIVEWNSSGWGVIHADRGDRVRVWRGWPSFVPEYQRISVGQRVRFTRVGYGRWPNTAAVVAPAGGEDEVRH